MNREVQGVVQVLIGGALLRTSLTDLYLRYVRGGLRPLLVLAGAVLVVAGIATLWYELRRGRAARTAQAAPAVVAAPGAEAARDDPGPHETHGHREPRIAWLLLLPLFALVIVGPPALGSYAADRNGTALQRPPSFADLPAGDPLRISVHDYATRAVYDAGHGMAGRRIALTGFITFGHGGSPYLTRMVMSCCAADALPIKVGLAGQVPAALPANAWIEVTGGYTSRRVSDEVNDGAIPFIDVSTARRVAAPRQPYES